MSMDRREKEVVKDTKMQLWEGIYMLDYFWDLLIVLCQWVWEFVPVKMWGKCAKPNEERKNYQFASELWKQKNDGWKDNAKTRHLKHSN